MAVIRPEWATTNPLNPGPEVYAPPDRRTPEQRSDTDRVAVLRSQVVEAAQSNHRSAETLDALMRRIAGASIDEIDGVMRELESVREMLRSEGARISREIAGYAALCQESTTAMKTIANSITKWKDGDASS
jgi:enoyl reductase-like protein